MQLTKNTMQKFVATTLCTFRCTHRRPPSRRRRRQPCLLPLTMRDSIHNFSVGYMSCVKQIGNSEKVV